MLVLRVALSVVVLWWYGGTEETPRSAGSGEGELGSRQRRRQRLFCSRRRPAAAGTAGARGWGGRRDGWTQTRHSGGDNWEPCGVLQTGSGEVRRVREPRRHGSLCDLREALSSTRPVVDARSVPKSVLFTRA